MVICFFLCCFQFLFNFFFLPLSNASMLFSGLSALCALWQSILSSTSKIVLFSLEDFFFGSFDRSFLFFNEMKQAKSSDTLVQVDTSNRLCVLLVECIFILCERMKRRTETKEKIEQQQHKKNKKRHQRVWPGLVYVDIMCFYVFLSPSFLLHFFILGPFLLTCIFGT